MHMLDIDVMKVLCDNSLILLRKLCLSEDNSPLSNGSMHLGD